MEAPLPIPLRSLPVSDILSPEQWETLLSIADTIIPSCTVDKTSDPTESQAVDQAIAKIASYDSEPRAVDLVKQYLEESPSKMPKFREALEKTLILFVPQDKRKALSMVLSALRYG